MTKVYLGVLEIVANIYFGVVVGLVSIYVVSDFWRAPSKPSATYHHFSVGGPSKGLWFVCHCQKNFLRFSFAFGSSNDIKHKFVTK